MDYVQFENEGYYKIPNIDSLRPFFMSVVSDSDHWLFISSNGGLSAGRKNSNYALFPYYTDDKITEYYELTGNKSIFRIQEGGSFKIWEPFSDRYTGVFRLTRNLYKNEFGNKIIFEEINHDLNLLFSYSWNFSDKFGFVKTSRLVNQSQNSISLELIDGIQNVLPFGVNPDLQQSASNLVDAYKKTEIISDSQLGLFTLSAIIVDKAEPSEALKANVAWNVGLKNTQILLSSLQLNAFRKGEEIRAENDIRAEKGAYLIHTKLELQPKEEKRWMILADVNKGPSAVINLSEYIKKSGDLQAEIKADIALGTKNLRALTASADGLQLSSDQRRNSRHFANVLFNIMRGGIFDYNYSIEKKDFVPYLAKANKKVFAANKHQIEQLPEQFPQTELQQIAENSEDKDFSRLCLEYLPLKFSRRHGDPSRPWNKFSINTKSESDGSKILDYQGNWRDIFQNWEALAYSYPEFIESMIHKFLNASTFDGYNPYRVTKDGFDWETIEPDDPWSYIGYWGDHQIIYLLKFLEISEKHFADKLSSNFKKDVFVYANVPYKIKSYQEILDNPKDTIDFDFDLDHQIRERRDQMGADAALLSAGNQEIYNVNFLEKLLATLLSKISNFIPEGGIWMNTQRPEWNDANNALVGNGVSMVTLYYIRRFLSFFEELLRNSDFESSPVSEELVKLFNEIEATLKSNQQLLKGKISNQDRKTVMDGLGEAGSRFRNVIYKNGFSSQKAALTKTQLLEFTQLTLQFVDHSIKANKRKDGLYHAYNLMTLENDKEVSISYLSEMLEGQVAVLSSGYLSPKESLEVLDSLKKSELFREDQYSYILYPNKQRPLFVDRNRVPKKAVKNSKLLQKLLQEGNTQIIEQDVLGDYHFNGNFNNAESLKKALSQLDGSYQELVEKEKKSLLQTFESVFNHKAFTGRSGTFYGYEGLGSIYWHMVSKLALAAQECCVQAIEQQENDEIIGKLIAHYFEINEGIGVHKSPGLYGAFPTDPYSHTPGGRGAQQPGMTGQVKEDILTRFTELGVKIQDGQIYFQTTILRKEEFLSQAQSFSYFDLNHQEKSLEIPANSLAFTYCQVPIVYHIHEEEKIKVQFSKGEVKEIPSTILDESLSTKLFQRTGEITEIHVYIKKP
jgi:hypothetical protein